MYRKDLSDLDYQLSRKVKFYSYKFSIDEKIQIIGLVSVEIDCIEADPSLVHVSRGAMTLAESISYDIGR